MRPFQRQCISSIVSSANGWGRILPASWCRVLLSRARVCSRKKRFTRGPYMMSGRSKQTIQFLAQFLAKPLAGLCLIVSMDAALADNVTPVLSENSIRWRFSHATFPAMRETFPVSSRKFPVQVRRELWRNQLTYSRKTEPSSRLRG